MQVKVVTVETPLPSVVASIEEVPDEDDVIQHLVCYTCRTSVFDPKEEASAAKVKK
ncbi:uncharacterized protein F5891DRAFT_1179711 [Suillus fuscotomentosus]|uniref:Uncharacterized protein n=1 Tax=Suillus fuscotomentosus TaxID=1912939 RepID=A0AAD4EL48_9AGAM|nr:uncharacterized protein F5891DRAFT_1179711 [Suillus fuscotomentosus]KAG1908198.1 hypothetical protein F5891DRAFT_1179711 [Suillus fuscotomentosus]